MKQAFTSWDSRRSIAIPGDFQMSVAFAVKHFIHLAQEAIAQHGAFYVALSGGSTPKAMFEKTLPGAL